MQDTMTDSSFDSVFDLNDDLIDAFVAQAQRAHGEALPTFGSIREPGRRFAVFDRSTLMKIAEVSIAALSGRLHYFSNRR